MSASFCDKHIEKQNKNALWLFLLLQQLHERIKNDSPTFERSSLVPNAHDYVLAACFGGSTVVEKKVLLILPELKIFAPAFVLRRKLDSTGLQGVAAVAMEECVWVRVKETASLHPKKRPTFTRFHSHTHFLTHTHTRTSISSLQRHGLSKKPCSLLLTVGIMLRGGVAALKAVAGLFSLTEEGRTPDLNTPSPPPLRFCGRAFFCCKLPFEWWRTTCTRETSASSLAKEKKRAASIKCGGEEEKKNGPPPTVSFRTWSIHPSIHLSPFVVLCYF